ncbi:MAG: AMIN domain-containing protein, partial [Gammaproteobacteria bacterium PRO8]|nr:AMIN domain-containing protein [Gammaproteobacteria bacterium PRO8]
MGAKGGLLGRALAAGATATFTALAAMAALFLAVPPALAADAALQLQDLQVQTLPGNKVELEIKLSGAAPEPLSFTIENPARIALDFPDTVIALPSRRKDVGVGNLATIMAAESGGRTRVVLNLDSMVPYQTRVAGNSVFVTLGTAGSSAATSASAAAAPAAAVVAPGGA